MRVREVFQKLPLMKQAVMMGYGQLMVLGSRGTFPLLSLPVTMVFHLG